MAGNPRIVTEDVRFTWDGVSQRLPRGQVIDVPPGSALEDAIGRHRLVSMFGAAPVTVAAEPAEEPQDAPEATGEAETQDEPETSPQGAGKSRKSAVKDSGGGDGGQS